MSTEANHAELMAELTVGIAEILGALERSGASTDKIAAAIVEGLHQVASQSVPAPVVNNQINVPKPATTLRVDIEYGDNKLPSSMTITRIN